MTIEIHDEVTEAIERATKFLTETYDDGASNTEDFEDDNCIHISRGKYRFCFYNGQEKGRFTEKDIKRFGNLVDKILEKVNVSKVSK